MHRLFAFFIENTPSPTQWLIGAPPALFYAAAAIMLAACAKRRGWKTGYTRKLFHFAVFSAAAMVQAVWKTPGVCLFGSCVSVVVFYAVTRGKSHPWYEALARESDAPHRTAYVIIPYLATLIGGLAANILFPAGAVAGYLVAGMGDAIAEPVGTRWGRRRYRVPSFFGVACTRSVEGSTAVFAASVLALAVAIWISPVMSTTPHTLLLIPAIAMASTFVEAVSPHGWDNTTMQLVPAWLATLLLQGGVL